MRLTRDLRVDLFAILFALGTLHHEVEFVLEAWMVGPLSEYMERWGRVVETVGWPSSVASGLHLAVVLVSLAILVVPRRRELLGLLAVVFLLSQVASPHRIASHASLMAAALTLVLLLAAAEWIERARHRGSLGHPATDWCGWTLAGLRWICALTYFFAAFFKLNVGWFSRGSSAPDFLVPLARPLLDGLGAHSAFGPVLATLAIYGTLAVELTLPFLLFSPSTRLLGCFVGVVFHLLMVAQGVVNFPLLILACYPAFMSRAETRELLGLLTRPTIPRLVGTLVLSAGGLAAVVVMPKRFLYQSPWVLPWVPAANNVLVWAAFVFLGYVALALAPTLFRGRSAIVTEIGDRATDMPDGATGTPGLSPVRPAPGRWFAIASVAVVLAAFVYLNVGYLVGLPSAGALFMFSGLGADRGNHLVLRSLGATPRGQYVTIARFDPHGVTTREAQEFAAFTRWLDGPGRRYRISLNFLGYHLARICRSAPDTRVSLEVGTGPAQSRAFENVCREPAMLRHWTVLTPAQCHPRCGPILRRWASGEPL